MNESFKTISKDGEKNFHQVKISCLKSDSAYGAYLSSKYEALLKFYSIVCVKNLFQLFF